MKSDMQRARENTTVAGDYGRKTETRRALVLLILAISLFGVLNLFRPVLIAGPVDHLWCGPTEIWWHRGEGGIPSADAGLLRWTFCWCYHILFEAHALGRLWDANEFYPSTGMLATSDSVLSGQLLFAPLRLAGVPVLPALYLTLAGTCIAGCLLSGWALRRIGVFSLPEKAILVYGGHFALCVTSFLGHYQLFGFQLAPPFLLFTFLYVQRWQILDLVMACLLFSLGICFATYFGPMLLLLAVIASIPSIWRELKEIGVRGLAGRVGWKAIAIMAAFAAAVYCIQIRHYVGRTYLNQEDWGLFPAHSAKFHSLFTGFSLSSLWYGSQQPISDGQWERCSFPGFILLGGTLGLLCHWLVARWRGSKEFFPAGAESVEDGKMRRSMAVFMTLVFFSAWVFSWGPYTGGDTAYPLPFLLAMMVLPGAYGVRVPGRFSMLLALPAAFFLLVLVRRMGLRPSRHAALLSILCGTLMVESLTYTKAFSWSPDPAGIYQQVAKQLPWDTPLAEFPLGPPNSPLSFHISVAQLSGSTIHWCRIIAGYGALDSQEHQVLCAMDAELGDGSSTPRQIVAMCADTGVRHFLVHLDQYSEPVRAKWLECIASLGTRAELLMEDKGAILFRLD
jgi:hypothetical protein